MVNEADIFIKFIHRNTQQKEPEVIQYRNIQTIPHPSVKTDVTTDD